LQLNDEDETHVLRIGFSTELPRSERDDNRNFRRDEFDHFADND